MDLQLEGKRALVTGSTGGIGEGIAKALAQESAAVVVLGGYINGANLRVDGGYVASVN